MSASNRRIYFLLQTAAARQKKEADRELVAAAGISAAQAAVLVIVKEREVVHQKELAQTLQQHESAITTMIARLEAAGLVEKSRSASDARAWEIRLTRAGEAALPKARRVFARLNAQLDATLGGKRIDALARSLEAIIESDSETAEVDA